MNAHENQLPQCDHEHRRSSCASAMYIYVIMPVCNVYIVHVSRCTSFAACTISAAALAERGLIEQSKGRTSQNKPLVEYSKFDDLGALSSSDAGVMVSVTSIDEIAANSVSRAIFMPGHML
jgi:hypothetical protein